MYTQAELKAATNAIRQVAIEEGIPEWNIRMVMKQAMEIGRRNPDPAIQSRWAGFRYAGPEPTLEEYLLWLTRMMDQEINQEE